MELLQHQQLWEMSRTRQAELVREARQAHLARLLPRRQPRLWAMVARWRQRRPHLAAPASATPKLG
jgi:hypothetical protein